MAQCDFDVEACYFVEAVFYWVLVVGDLGGDCGDDVVGELWQLGVQGGGCFFGKCRLYDHCG